MEYNFKILQGYKPPLPKGTTSVYKSTSVGKSEIRINLMTQTVEQRINEAIHNPIFRLSELQKSVLVDALEEIRILSKRNKAHESQIVNLQRKQINALLQDVNNLRKNNIQLKKKLKKWEKN